MKMLRQFLPIIFGIIFWKTDATVTVIPGNSLANIETFICGTSENVICTISPFGGTMTWQIGSTLAANCISGTCTINSLFSADYSFLFNTTTGVFNLIIKQVTVSVNGTTFSCDDGLTSNATQANVKVTNDFETARKETTSNTSRNQTQMKITTGCLKENTASKVNIFWYFLKVNGSGSRERFLNTSKGQETTSEDNSACEADPDCGSPGFTQISSELSITEDGVGELYMFEVDIDFGIPERNKRVVFNVSLQLNFGPFCVCDCYELLIVAGSAELIHIVLGLLLFVTWKDRDNSTDDKYFATAFEYLIVLCDLLWIVMFALYLWSFIICFEGDCICSEIVRVAGFILLSLLVIHIILGCILLCLLYCSNGTVMGKDKCSTSKGTFIRSICSTIPVAGLFAVCQWLVSVCCSEKPVRNNKTEDTLERGKTEKKSSRDSEAFPNISPKKSGRKLSKSAQRRENKKIDNHLSTERSDLSSKGETDNLSTSDVILKNRTKNKSEFAKRKDSSPAVETARNNVPPKSTADHNKKGTRKENRSDNGGSVASSSSKKKKKTSRAKLESSIVDKTSSGDLHKSLSTEEQTSTSHGNDKQVIVLDSKKKSDGSQSPSTEKSYNPSTSRITSPNSTKGDQIKSHTGEEHTNTSHGNVKHVIVLESKKKPDGSPSPSTEKYYNSSTSHITSPNSTKGDQIKSHSGEEHTKSETIKRALSANFTDDDDDTTEVSDDPSKMLNRENTPL